MLHRLLGKHLKRKRGVPLLLPFLFAARTGDVVAGAAPSMWIPEDEDQPRNAVADSRME